MTKACSCCLVPHSVRVSCSTLPLYCLSSDITDPRPGSSTETESTGTSGQRSTPIRPSGPRSDVLTSTPNMSSAGDTPSIQSPVQPICEGMFVGRAQHKDGSSLGLLFQVKLREFYLYWIALSVVNCSS